MIVGTSKPRPGVDHAWKGSWKNAGATDGKELGAHRRERRVNKRNRLPWLATGCRKRSMVRRGRRFESVRGLCKVPANRGFPYQLDLHHFEHASGMEAIME